MRLHVAPVAIAMMVMPTICACGTSGASDLCSSSTQRTLESTISSVESRANVKSFHADAPTCGSEASGDPHQLVAQRSYPSRTGVTGAIEFRSGQERLGVDPGVGG